MIQTESEIWYLFVYISTLRVSKNTCPRCLIRNYMSTMSYPKLNGHDVLSETEWPRCLIRNYMCTMSYPKLHVHDVLSETTCPRCLIRNTWGQIRFGTENFLGFRKVIQYIYRVLRNISSGSGAGHSPDQKNYYFGRETFEYSH